MEIESHSINQFCLAHGICRSKYYKLKKERKGPHEMRVGARVLISREAAADWRLQREAEAQRETPKRWRRRERCAQSEAPAPRATRRRAQMIGLAKLIAD